MNKKEHIYKLLPLFDKIGMFQTMVDNIGNAKGTDSYEYFVESIKTMKTIIDEEIVRMKDEEGIDKKDRENINWYFSILNRNKELFEENNTNAMSADLCYWISHFKNECDIKTGSLNILHDGEVGIKEFMERIQKIDEQYNDLVVKYNKLLKTFKDYLEYTKF